MNKKAVYFCAGFLPLAVLSFVFLPASGETEGAQTALESILAPDELGNVIPDFSMAGYMGGGVAIPDVPVVKELSPEPGEDDRERIQAALDEIGRMAPDGDGFRGALLLRAGEYRVHGYLHIRESGIVLRGEGQFPGGTTLTATKKNHLVELPQHKGIFRDHALIYVGNIETYWPPRLGFLKPAGNTRTGIIDEAVPVGSMEITVKDAGNFNAGDNIVIEVFPNVKWLETLGLEDAWSGWAGRSGGWTRLRYERRITGINGNRLALDAPMVFYLDRGHFEQLLVWKYGEDGRVSRSGVENLRLKSYFNEDNYSGLENFMEEESHARTGVYLERARDCWVRNVTTLYFWGEAVNIQPGARNITVQDCAYLRPASRVAGSKRYPFAAYGSRVLVQRCYAREGRHAFATTSRTAGPNVFLDGLAEKNHADIGPHMAWDTGGLFDNIAAPQGRIEVRKARGGHGWRGANQVFWNCRTARMLCPQPETGDTNWSIGSVACKAPQEPAERGIWQSVGSHVEPRSLYLWQLEERLGEEAVRNITIDIQRQGDSAKIYDYLKNKFAELNERELAEDNNLLRDPGFRLPGNQPWTLGSNNPVSTLERAVNPVYGDDTAVTVPADEQLRYRYNTITKYPSFSPAEYELKFDYKMEEGAGLRALVSYLIVPGWQTVGSYAGPSVKGGGGKWHNYSFNFKLEPVPDEKTGMPYRKIIFIRFISDDEFAFANPSVEIVE